MMVGNPILVLRKQENESMQHQFLGACELQEFWKVL